MAGRALRGESGRWSGAEGAECRGAAVRGGLGVGGVWVLPPVSRRCISGGTNIGGKWHFKLKFGIYVNYVVTISHQQFWELPTTAQASVLCSSRYPEMLRVSASPCGQNGINSSDLLFDAAFGLH